MARQVMRRNAGENQTLHQDFHGALNAGIEYVHENFGAEAVREYLWQFARSYYAPLTKALEQRGLVALEEHFRRVYELEEGGVSFTLSEDELRIDVEACPAVTHMRERGYPVARLFRETTDTVNRAICHGTSFTAELLDYDPRTGGGIQRFYRGKP